MKIFLKVKGELYLGPGISFLKSTYYWNMMVMVVVADWLLVGVCIWWLGLYLKMLFHAKGLLNSWTDVSNCYVLESPLQPELCRILSWKKKKKNQPCTIIKIANNHHQNMWLSSFLNVQKHIYFKVTDH